MYKPGNLRQFLVAAIPELAHAPDRLSIYIDQGGLRTTIAPGLSWEYSYTLNLIITDFAADPDILMAPIVDWMRVHQPDTLANPNLAERAIGFEVDVLNNDAVDVAITLQLTERAICRPRADGGYDVTHPPEPQPEPRLESPKHWQLYANDILAAEWDQPDP